MSSSTNNLLGGAEVEVFYDGDCPLCLREIQILQWFDKKRDKIRFTDIAAADFSAESYGKTQEDLMAEIHGRLPSGEWIIGVEVFRRLYSAIGFGTLVLPTRIPGVSHLLDAGYTFFAKYRLRITGRCHEGKCDVSHQAVQTDRVSKRPSS